MRSSIETRVEKMLSNISLDEKLAQLGSVWIYELSTQGELDPEKLARKCKHGIGQISRVGGASTLDPRSAAKTINQVQRFLLEQTRPGIPAIMHEESCLGAMMLGGTMFPQMIGLAATFQPQLAEAMTTAIRSQLLAVGARQALAPVLDIARDPRWGRIEETFGEDPTLACHFAVAYTKGLQSDDLSQGVLATGKHFVGHSLSLGGLNCGPVDLGMRGLYEVYLAPFQAAIRDAGLAAIMNAYPELDGEVIAASGRLLTHLLREELGFDGLLVSDYNSISMINDFHHAAPNKAAAACRAISAGIDVELPSTDCYGDPLREALEKGDISLELIDRAVRRHLRKKVELGLFENPYVDEGRALEVFDAVEDRALAHRIASQSIVLLKNDGTLPLEKTIRTLAVIGPNADVGRNLLGDYSYASMRALLAQHEPDGANLADLKSDSLGLHDIAITTVLAGIRGVVSPETRLLYAKGCEVQGGDTQHFEEAVGAAARADAAILVLGDRSGLTPDCTTGEFRDSADLQLPGLQEALARAVIGTGTPVVVVLVNGRPFAMPWLSEHAHAILEAWLPGEEGGSAIADILFGNTNPAGRLPVTFPRAVGQVPVFYNHKPSGRRSYWYGDYVVESVEPLYPFGHGLSYTTFEYRDLSLSEARATSGDQVEISLKVANTGSRAGDEVVQLYTRDEVASIPRPVKELRGYARVTLQPGEVRGVTFQLPVDQCAFYDADLDLILEPGRILVMLGSSSEDIRLESSFEVTGPATMKVAERVFVCPVEVGLPLAAGT